MRRAPISPEAKILELLAKRDHSEKELRQKLSKKFEPAQISAAIEHAKIKGWLAKPEVLAEKTRSRLDRKGKGTLFVQQYLIKKGLPKIKPDLDQEVEKGLRLVIKTLKLEPPFSFEQKKKIQPWLARRGYLAEAIRTILQTKGTSF